MEFFDRRDAADALRAMDRYEIDGREMSVVFAKDRRKTPQEMRHTTRGGGRYDDRGGGGGYRDHNGDRGRDRGGYRDDRDDRRRRYTSRIFCKS